MIVPTIATIVVGTAGLLDQVDQASGAERARLLTVLSGEAGALVHSLQDERTSAIQLLYSPPASPGSPQDRVHRAAGQDRSRQGALPAEPDHDRRGPAQPAHPAGRDSDRSSVELPTLRAQVAELNKVPLSIAERRYRVLISDLLEIRDLSAQLTGDTHADRPDARRRRGRDGQGVHVPGAGHRPGRARRRTNCRRPRATTTSPRRQGQELALGNFRAVATPAQIELYRPHGHRSAAS